MEFQNGTVKTTIVTDHFPLSNVMVSHVLCSEEPSLTLQAFVVLRGSTFDQHPGPLTYRNAC